MSAQIYCPSCGYPNDDVRGACLMCYTNVREPRAGNICPSCGSENPKTAIFCVSCQTALVEGAVPQRRPDVSGLVGAVAAGGAVALGDEYVAEPAGAMDFGAPDLEEADFDTEGPYEVAAPPPPPPPAHDTGVAADSAAFELEDYGLPTPSSDTDFTVEEVATPPPPPDTVDLDLDTAEGPPPPPAPPASERTDTGSASDDALAEWSLDYDA
ncbi:MAG: zinc ribbon domain-containing protein [Candidatus Zipacnadales bacterium]